MYVPNRIVADTCVSFTIDKGDAMKRHIDDLSLKVWDGELVWYYCVLESEHGIQEWRLSSPHNPNYRSDDLNRVCNACDCYFSSDDYGYDECPCCGENSISGADIETDVFDGDAPF